MIHWDWEPKDEQRLLMPGDAVLSLDTRAQKLGAPIDVLFQAQVLHVRPGAHNASVRCAREKRGGGLSRKAQR